MNSPYDKYKHLKEWDIIKTALEELEENQDISITTHSDYVIGYLLHKLKTE